jgi:hypothetical protein
VGVESGGEDVTVHRVCRRSRPLPVCPSSQSPQLSRPLLATMTLRVPPMLQRPLGLRVCWYASPDLATRLTLIHEEGRTRRCLRVLTDERG